MNSKDCLFCAIVNGDIPANIIEESTDTVAFLDINPANPGHTLVIPKLHAADLYEITPTALAASIQSAQTIALRLRDRLDAEGVNLINSCKPAAWQTVFHFHIHVIPRYSSDTLKLPWQPTACPQEQLQQTAELLQP